MSESYKRNLRTLKRRIPYLYDKIKNDKDQYDTKILELDNDKNYILEYDNKRVFANSIYGIQREVEHYFKDINDNVRTVILFGSGNGDVLEEVSRKYNQIEQFILIEPSLNAFKQMLNYINLEKLISKFSISFVINVNPSKAVELTNELISQSLSSNIHVISTISYVSIFSNYYKEFSYEMMRVLRRELTNVATSFNIPYKRLVNIMTNLKESGRDIMEVKDFIKEKTVFLVSAGPSLSKTIDLIEEAKKYGVVIAVGTAIEILDQKGVTPHFRAAFSPHEDITIFKNLNDETIPLIYLDTLYHDILPSYQGIKYRILSHSNTLSKYAYDYVDIEYDEVITEISIANTIFEMCLNAGANQIVLLGQDLAYTDMKMYADGSLLNKSVENDTSKLLKEKGNYGKEVYTDVKFISMRDAIARSYIRNSENKVKIYNCSEEGLLIPFTESISIDRYLELSKVVEDLNAQYVDLLERESNQNEEIYKNKITKVVERIRNEIGLIKDINEKRIEELTILIKMKEEGKNTANILNKYKDINKFEQQITEVPLYNKVIKYEFDGIFKSIISGFKYNGNNLYRQLDAVESILVRVCLEVRKIIRTFEMLIDEYYGIEYPEGIGKNEVIDKNLERTIKEFTEENNFQMKEKLN